MAEATERPADEQRVVPSIPAAPPAPTPDEDALRPYSSVSLLAIAACVPAAGYALVVVVGGVIAFCNHSPFILPFWSLFFPLVAVVLALAARSRIHNSEGALSGTSLTTWAAFTALGAGCVYAAYYFGCYWALASQAQTFADGWLDLLKQDKIDQVFLLSLPPDNRPRPDDPNLRGRLELDFDRERGGGPGQYTQFRQSQIVRQFAQGAADAKVQFLGVQQWEYDKSAYQVQLSYRVATRGMSADVILTAVGVDGADESGGRVWYIKDSLQVGAPALTDEGRRMNDLGPKARAFAQRWIDEVSGWQWDNAYLDTLPPVERAAQDKDRGGEAFRKGLAAFRAGGVAQADSKTFWAPPKDRDAKIAMVRGLFGPMGENPDNMILGPAMPLYLRDEDQVRFGFDVTITLTSLGDQVQARLMVAADARAADAGQADWRVETLDLISAKSMAASPTPQPRAPLALPKR